SYSVATADRGGKATTIPQYSFFPTHLIPHCVRNDNASLGCCTWNAFDFVSALGYENTLEIRKAVGIY
ncbi:MAG TPA: hypothetical protein VGE04_06810, partial [Chloroflexia bacterium]